VGPLANGGPTDHSEIETPMRRLTFTNMSKSYGGVPALSDVSLTLEAGRVHALMGENGAGKSTLIKLIAGVVRADSLAVDLGGTALPLHSAQDAHDAGFRFIHQELNIVPQISVAENILLGHRLPRRFGFAIDWKTLRGRARDALAFLGAAHIDVKDLAGTLPPGDKMLVKIAAALVSESGAQARLYVLDEPTAALTQHESELLFDVIDRLKRQGAAVLYVSHRIDEVLRICDDITILRDGRHVSSGPVSGTDKPAIINAMTGRDVSSAYPARKTDIGPAVIASLRDVCTKDLRGLNVDLHEGEILGVSGLAQAGQSAFLRLFMGLETVRSGNGSLVGKRLPVSPSQAWHRKVAYVPRERRGDALMLDMSVRSNIVLPHLGGYGIRAKRRAEAADARDLGTMVRLKHDGPDQPVVQLSGGNQQKVVFARALFGNPRLLLLDEPTRGVDVGAKYDIYQLVRSLSAQGCAVILTSSDLPEILGMCDRILVLQEGRQTHLVARDTMSSADLLSQFYQSEVA
jgi:ribose transport system ATP-binding protein